MDELITNMKKSSIRGNGIVYLLKKNGDVIYYPNQNNLLPQSKYKKPQLSG